MDWGSEAVCFCRKHVYDFLSSSTLPTPPSLAAPWHQKAPKVHQSVLGWKFPCLQKIILALLFLILWQIRTKCCGDKILYGKALPLSTQLYSKAIERIKLTAKLLLPWHIKPISWATFRVYSHTRLLSLFFSLYLHLSILSNRQWGGGSQERDILACSLIVLKGEVLSLS